MKFHTILFTCRLCGKQGTAQADADCPPEQIDIFAKCICCHGCFETREKLRKAEDAIFRTCHFLNNIDQFKNPEKIQSRARQVLNEATRSLAEAWCSKHGLQTVFEPSFPEMLCDRPDMAGKILAGYKRGVVELARPAQRELATA